MGYAGILTLVLVLTLVGSTALILVTVKYYWGERGKPLPKGEERRKQKEAELRLRAKQIENASRRPIKPRNPSFWDNTKTK